MLYHLIAGHSPFEASSQASLMHQICHVEPPSLVGVRTGVSPALDRVVRRCTAKRRRPPSLVGGARRALSGLIAMQHVPRGAVQGVLDSERFTLLRTLDFFTRFGDVALWEVVRARWERLPAGQALYRRGEEGRTTRIIATGTLESGATAGAWRCWARAPRLARWPIWRPIRSCGCTAPT